MATPRQNINNGTNANDGTGDSLRTAADKINQNFITLFNKFGNRDSQVTDFLYIDSDGSINFQPNGSVSNNRIILKSEETPSAIRTITVPNVSGRMVVDVDSATLTNKTLLNPIVDVLLDSDRHEILKLKGIVNCSNYLEISNGNGNTHPQISARGDSDDIGIFITPKGNERIHLKKAVVEQTETITDNNSNADTFLPVSILNSPVGGQTVFLRDSAEVGQIKKFLNINSGGWYVTPNTFVNGAYTSVLVQNRGYISFMWTGAQGWFVMGDNSDSDSRITYVP